MNLIKRLGRGSIVALPVAAFLGGCASVNPPTPVVVIPEFNVTSAGTNNNIDLNQTPSGASKNTYRITDPALQKFASLPPENDIKAIQDQLRLYAATWYRQSAIYTDWGNDLSHAQFYSALLGGISALTKSPQGATVGVGLAGATGLVSSHYALTVQSANYSKGADAMQCMYDEISTIPNPVWTDLYDPTIGEFRYTKAQIQSQLKDNPEELKATLASYDMLAGMIPAVRKNIDGIIRNLRNAQQTVILATPSSTDIQNAITKAVVANVAATSTAPDAANGLQTTKKKAAGVTSTDTLSSLSNRLVTLKLNLNQVKAMAFTEENITKQASTQDEINKIEAKISSMSPLTADEISQLILLPAAMTKCVTLTGTAPDGGTPATPVKTPGS